MPNEALPVSSTSKAVNGQCFSLKAMQVISGCVHTSLRISIALLELHRPPLTCMSAWKAGAAPHWQAALPWTVWCRSTMVSCGSSQHLQAAPIAASTGCKGRARLPPRPPVSLRRGSAPSLPPPADGRPCRGPSSGHGGDSHLRGPVPPGQRSTVNQLLSGCLAPPAHPSSLAAGSSAALHSSCRCHAAALAATSLLEGPCTHSRNRGALRCMHRASWL